LRPRPRGLSRVPRPAGLHPLEHGRSGRRRRHRRGDLPRVRTHRRRAGRAHPLPPSPAPASARKPGGEPTVNDQTVNVRYMVDDVEEAIAFYTGHLGFSLLSNAAPAFADVLRGNLRLLLSGPRSSAGRPMPDGRIPAPGGWNRIHLIVADIATAVE